MCLMVFAWRAHPDYPLILAANRDEFYLRRTRPAAWWGQAVSLLAGHDEEAGGTWLGITRRGRFAALTNVRAPAERNPHAPSRGALVLSALQAADPPASWLEANAARMAVYNGFNLLVGDVAPAGQDAGHASQLHYFSNRLETPARVLAPGIYGLSNAFLDTPWPKVTRAVGDFACAIASRVDIAQLVALMENRQLARDAELPATGVPLDWERVLSAIQIRANGYGTRATSVLTVRSDGLAALFERSYDTADPDRCADRHYEFMIDRAAEPVGRLKAPRSQ